MLIFVIVCALYAGHFVAFKSFTRDFVRILCKLYTVFRAQPVEGMIQPYTASKFSNQQKKQHQSARFRASSAEVRGMFLNLSEMI